MSEEETAPSDPPDAARGRPIRSYVLRAGRVGSGQRRALDELGPRFVLPYAPAPLDRRSAFGRDAPLVVEIGFGMGDATAAIAAALPDTDFLAIDVHAPGVGGLLRRIGERDLGNVRIVCHDAVEVLDRMIAPASLAGVHVFFPDPWPKKRHHKRRLIQPPFAALLASRLAPGGYLHCATDWEPYAEQMLEVLAGRTAARQHRRRLCAAARLPAADEVRGPRPEARPRRARPRLHARHGRRRRAPA